MFREGWWFEYCVSIAMIALADSVFGGMRLYDFITREKDMKIYCVDGDIFAIGAGQ